MTASIKITSTFDRLITDIVMAGKTAWVIVNEDYAVGAYAGRTEARAAKVAENLAGKILKASEVTFEVIVPAEEHFHSVTEAEHAAHRGEVANKSTTERPCKRVWIIADDMLAANPEVKRKDVIAACIAAGVAFYTARTQYQQWLGVRKEMAAREAAKK